MTGLREALARGVALFNAQRFWEAHEAWEEAWMNLEGDEKLFVQGLIQVAAGYYKATVQDQPRGCVKLLTAALEKLDPMPPDYLGIETQRFLPEVRRTLLEAQVWLRASGPPPSSLPQLEQV